MFSVVFRVRWQTGGDDNASFALNLFAGVIVHGFFAECVNRSPTLIAENTGYVKKVVFPLWMIPAIVVVAAMFHMLVSLLVLLICSGLYLQQFHFSVLVMMFMAPVFYPVEALPEAFRPWMYLNPLTFVIGEMRGLVLSGAMPHWATLAKFTAIALLVALAGWKVFRKAQPGFADVL